MTAPVRTDPIDSGSPPSGAAARREPPAPSLLRLVRIELRKAVDTRAGRWLLAVVVLLASAVCVLQLTTAPAEERSLEPTFLGQQAIVCLLLPVVGILLATGEWSTRAVMTTYALVPRRGRTTAAKVGAGVVLSLASVVANLAVAVAATSVLAVVGPPSAAGVDRFDLHWALVAQAALLEVVMVTAGVGLGLALLSSPLAIVTYVAAPFALSVLLDSVAALRAPGSWVDLDTTFWRLLEPDLGDRDWARLAVSVLVWCALPLALGAVRVGRREPA